MSDASPTSTASRPAKPEKEEESWADILKTLVYAVLIALFLRTVFYKPFSIPSESMLPNLLIGDYLFVSQFSYGYSRFSLPLGPPLFSGRIFDTPPKRGDIVVFKLPRDDRTDYIKRVIGLPGDEIRMVHGVLVINGKPVKKERIDDFVIPVTGNTDCRDRPRYRVALADGTLACKYPRYRETLPGGRTYQVLDLDPEGPSDTIGPWIVPDGHYFMMGDNRDASLDSRRPISIGVGFVPFENLVGRAEIIFFSTDGSAKLWTPWRWIQAARFDRLFDSLRRDHQD
ncbi:MAG: signal peptidase I [Sphingomonadales bacterium]